MEVQQVRIVGDVHGKVSKYVDLVRGIDYSVQIGDMAFDYQGLLALDPNKHKFLGGNHDDYDKYFNIPHSLGDFGQASVGPLDFFFIRGAFSIDYKSRKAYDLIHRTKCWWEEEQLSRVHMQLAYEAYIAAKPKVMITHSCPIEISRMTGNPGVLQAFGFNPETFSTNTQELLQRCFEEHKPEVWIYGHFHQNLDFEYKGTRFICLDELCHIDYIDGEFINKNKVKK